MRWLIIASFITGSIWGDSVYYTSKQEEEASLVGFELKYVPIQGTQGQALVAALEWLPFRIYGTIGLGLEGGYFAESFQPNPKERIYTAPLNGRLSYHFDYFENQLIVPFATATNRLFYIHTPLQSPEGGLDQISYSLGGQILLNGLDAHGSKTFSRRFGVDHSYLIAEYNFSDESYRLGLRFEF